MFLPDTLNQTGKCLFVRIHSVIGTRSVERLTRSIEGLGVGRSLHVGFDPSP